MATATEGKVNVRDKIYIGGEWVESGGRACWRWSTPPPRR